MVRATLLAVLFCFAAACGGDDTETKDTSDTSADLPDETCTDVVTLEGNTGTYVVNTAVDDTRRHHWFMVTGVDHIHATVTWTPPDVPWLIEAQAGSGQCVDDGVALGDPVQGDAGELVIDVYPADEGEGLTTFTPDMQYFLRVTLADREGHVDGDALDYAVTVQHCTSNAAK